MGSVAQSALVPSGTIRDCLKRVIESPSFKVSPKLAAFLKFVVEATLNGQAERIKAYTVGVDALGKPDSFDPIIDSIVRVEAGRLRAALARYYQGVGAEDPVLIALPRGNYVPEFHQRDPANYPTATAKSANGPIALLLLRERAAALDAYVASSKAVIEEGQSTLRQSQELFAACRSHVQEIHRHFVGMSAEIEAARAILVRSRRLIELSRNRKHASDGRMRRVSRPHARRTSCRAALKMSRAIQ